MLPLFFFIVGLQNTVFLPSLTETSVQRQHGI